MNHSPATTVTDGETPTPAPYGQACSNCQRAKCRCSQRGPGLSCERCHRLSKTCQPAASVRRRGQKRQTRTAHLEEKLDGLVSLLSDQLKGKPTPSVPEKLTPPEHPCPVSFGFASTHLPSHTGSGSLSNDLPISFAAQQNTVFPQLRHGCAGPMPAILTPPTTTPTAGASPASSSLRTMVDAGPPDLTEFEAETSLQVFRSHHLRSFPLMYIPTNVTALELKRTRPFVWLCIMSVTPRSLSQQEYLSRKVRDVLAHLIIGQEERSVDIVLGILIIVSWSVYHSHGRPFVAMYMSMAMSMTCELGLDRSPSQLARGPVCFRPPTMMGIDHPRKESPEEKRLLLACYVLNSTVMTFHCRSNPIPWSDYMEQCLIDLNDQCEWPGDQILANQVRSQRLLDDIAQTPWRLQDIGQTIDASMPADVYVKLIREKLAALRAATPMSSIDATPTVRLFHEAVDINALELLLYSRSPSTSDTRSLEGYYALLHSVPKWFEDLFKVPVKDYIGLPFFVFTQLGTAIQVIYRLTVLEAPGWNRGAVREVVDMQVVLDRLADNMERVKEAVGPVLGMPDGDIFSRAAKMLRSLKPMYDDLGKVSETATDQFLLPLQDSDDIWLTEMFMNGLDRYSYRDFAGVPG